LPGNKIKYLRLVLLFLLLPGYEYLLGVTHSRDCTRHMRSNLGMSASCVYVTEKRGLATYSRRILWENQFPELPRCSWR